MNENIKLLRETFDILQGIKGSVKIWSILQIGSEITNTKEEQAREVLTEIIERQTAIQPNQEFLFYAPSSFYIKLLEEILQEAGTGKAS